MKIVNEGKLLRVFIGESDRYHNKPTYEYILLKAKELGLAGVTILRGIEGYGATSQIHTVKVLRLSEKLPIIIEIIDAQDPIQKIKAEVEKVFEESGCGGLITLEKVDIIKYVPEKK